MDKWCNICFNKRIYNKFLFPFHLIENNIELDRKKLLKEWSKDYNYVQNLFFIRNLVKMIKQLEG